MKTTKFDNKIREISQKIMLGIGKWIMLITKLPTVVSPPKMSIHWSYPNVTPEILKAYVKTYIRSIYSCSKSAITKSDINEMVSRLKNQSVIYNHEGLMEPDVPNARKIYYKRERISVWGNEYKILSGDRLKEYLESSHVLVADTVAQSKLLNSVLNKEARAIMEAALLDGCSEHEAILTALEQDIFSDYTCIEPLGWYKIRPEYGLAFATEEELEE